MRTNTNVRCSVALFNSEPQQGRRIASRKMELKKIFFYDKFPKRISSGGSYNAEKGEIVKEEKDE